MATPPPEAPSDFKKEEKPQLPPSPNGVSPAAVDRASPQDAVASAKPDAPVDGAGKPSEEITAASVNGHDAEQPSVTNGLAATASPPKSPSLPSADTPAQPAVASEDKKPSNVDSVAAGQGDKPSGSNSAPVTDKAPGSAADPLSPKNTQASPDTSKPSTDTSDAKVESTTQSSHNAGPVRTELPHHPSNSPSKSVDHEMRDAPDVPVSPTKVTRERESDHGDEPAAKRTKIGGGGPSATDFKVPSLPTPATESRSANSSNGYSGMTKVQHKFLLKSIQSLKRMHDSRFYREPVDPIKLNIPHYPQIIKQPMDLGTIERKLKFNEYRTAQAVIDDFRLMCQNSLTFNGPDHPVAQEGQKLRATFEKQMHNLPRPDEMEDKKPKKFPPKTSAARREPRAAPSPSTARATGSSPQSTTFALGPEGLPLIRRDSAANADGRPKRSIHPPKRDLPFSAKPKKKKYQWELRFCTEVCEEMYKPKHFNYAAPFYYPVDPVALNIPTYHSIIKKPMDLSTVQTKLKNNQYENAKEFELDMRLIFKNCFKFNIPGDPTYVAGQRLEEVFNQKWAQKTRYLEAHEPHPEHQSAAESSEEESEEEAEESDYDAEKLSMLQKQMEEMTRQIEAITQKKKKTPPGSKKLSKSKPPLKKEVKKPGSVGLSSVKKDKKSGTKSAKPEKQRWVTYQEKQIISNGISNLPDKKMQEALKIIQSNVPALKGTQETEIELDIDELPNEVLLMLLRFVKKNAPQVMEHEDVVTPTVASTTTTAAPKPKKNKPMSKFEQEAQINMLESNLSRFSQGGAGRSPDPVPSVEANESSDDSEDDSEESEEE
ncbi:putative transcription regulator BDF1 [Aspergillus homomorphus CBS 101889]|uniref:Bromodomain-containing protein n=1 Tax=Aspergillus homomorphus (strain CBS 101889) TaxID=1450537 RepID=A0A395HU47_ASPHC|nr:Bromodomain-containing protein [Aspergillus homomorphus CBS 101889]RAL09734.1 Bromodomain-containing protein [Aspergillus homomorphus CBS 101889]